jgi:hypothetical protein
MARPVKEGLTYFNLDVDFFEDPKILFVEESHGIKGVFIAIKLLTWIYRNGYYIEWNDDMALLFSKRVGNGVSHSLASDVVSVLVKRKFFDEDIFNKYSILTSKGIQQRWQKVIQDCKRKASINSLYDLVNSVLSEFPPEETTPEQEETTQRKEKKSKEKKSKELFKNTQTDFPFADMRGKAFRPGPEDLDLELPESNLNGIIERMKIQKQLLLPPEVIQGMWKVFKGEQFKGGKLYPSQHDVFIHFSNWLKNQDFKNGTNAKPTIASSLSGIDQASNTIFG